MNTIAIINNARAAGKYVSDALIDWACERYNHTALGGRLYPNEEIAECEHCSAHYLTDDSTTVYTRGNQYRGFSTEEWCPDCVDHSTFTDVDGDVYYTPTFTEADCEGDTICVENPPCGAQQWSDGEWHYEEEEDEEDEEEGYQTNSGVSEYHSYGNNRWREVVSQRRGFGVELEIDVRENSHRVGSHVRGPSPVSTLLAEYDGSLSSQGVEFIGAPFTLLDYQSGNTPWVKLLNPDFISEFRARGYGSGNGYGMHVSVSRALFAGPVHLGKFASFINRAHFLSKTVAQRPNLYSTDYREGLSIRQGYRDCHGKYNAVSVGSKRVEVRIFRSNLRRDRFLKNVEYCAAVFAFSLETPLHVFRDGRQLTDVFIEWLSEARNRAAYPHLFNFLHGQIRRRNFLGGSDKVCKLTTFKPKRLAEVAVGSEEDA